MEHRSLTELLAGLPDGEASVVTLEPRVYEEKVFAEKRDLTLQGAGADRTVILWHDGALTMLDDGFKRGTFRSYTAFFGGERLVLRNLTIRNDAGDGRGVGQSVAAYLDSSYVVAENCVFDSYQDTLFLSPLPDEEREPRGFMGPREFDPRKLTRQYFKKCTIIGDVDFIFGGADAVFEDCDIICRDREHHPGFAEEAGQPEFINGYLTAPCGKRNGLGLVFIGCRIRAEEGTTPGTVYLGRPWRPEGKAAFINCVCDDSIAARRFSGWGAVDKDEPDAMLAEYRTVNADGDPVDMNGKNPWVKVLSDAEAAEIVRQADILKKEVLG
ncbi:MAG: pectin esterase [Lachnospiraceae bacterium]|nr:pectin esterase [Lachnospiraceae bacterium]